MYEWERQTDRESFRIAGWILKKDAIVLKNSTVARKKDTIAERWNWKESEYILSSKNFNSSKVDLVKSKW
jgi:hypothetical protein